jgi:DNA-directed RNA polymerase sigma subunit (sigma70/sigma32)
MRDVSTLYGLVLGLPERERVVLIEYYGLEGNPLSLRQIASRHNISRERARGLKARAEWRLRRRINLEEPATISLSKEGRQA